MASRYTLNINITFKDVDTLMKAGYNLCMTRDVAVEGVVTTGNAVFSAVLSEDLGPYITFQWQDLFQIYGITGLMSSFGEDEAIIQSATANIEAGQEATLNPNGSIDVSGSSMTSQPFQVDNQWKNPAQIGVKMYDSTEKAYFPIYVSPGVPRPSSTQFLPAQTYSVFFDKTLITGDIIGKKTSTPPFLFSFSSSQSALTLSYTDGIWRLGT